MIKISIIAAVGENRELGKGGKLLWQIPEDMKRFKKLTEGHVVIMGRKTFESLPKKFQPLPNRVNIIVTRDKKFSVSVHPTLINHLIKVIICYSLDEAIKNSKFEIQNSKLPSEIFVIGGGQIYQQAIKYADKLYLTIVAPLRKELRWGQADTFFPDYSEFKKIIYKKESRDKTYRYTFLELEK